MAASFDLANPNRAIHAGVILLNSTTELLDVAPFHMMGTLSDEVQDLPEAAWPARLRQQAMSIIPHWITETGQTGKLTAGLRVEPTDSFESCPPLDIVLMGACEMTYTPTQKELDFIRKCYSDCQAFIAVCGGYQPLLQAGLLSGKTAAAPRMVLDLVRKTCPEVNWVDRRWQRDGKIWTTGALINGLDGMRAFALEIWGGRGDLVQVATDGGSWPVRDVEYKDDEARRSA